MSQFDYYVALDLGSESMAAYFEHRKTAKGGMIQLQAHGATILGSNHVQLLKENGSTVSPRLRTRVTLEDNRQGSELKPDHARLDLISPSGERLDDCDQSLFTYFYAPDQALGGALLPNPKIPFQEGGADIIPRVATTNGRVKVRHSPNQILEHLTVQVVRNFVLNSPELRNVQAQRIHLTLTVPNVYSLVHVKNLLAFVRDHVDVGTVDYLFESDAVSYLCVAPQAADAPEDWEKFKQKILRRRDESRLRIMTIDIGRGTTDLSLVQIEAPVQSKEENRRHFVLARTGKSDGGNRLSYILARYYNDVFSSVFDAHGKKMPFSFLLGKEKVGSSQGLGLTALELLIDNVKKSMTARYRIGLSTEAQKRYIGPVIDVVLRAMDPNWDPDVNFDNRKVHGLPELSRDLHEALLLPKSLSFPWRREKRQQELLHEIKLYVEENVVCLIDELCDLTKAREAGPGDEKQTASRIFDPASTFVLVAGQGSQFKPIKAAIRKRVKGYGLSKSHLHFLHASSATEACCRGAVRHKRARVKQMNPFELHGSYGLLNLAPDTPAVQFRSADMWQIRLGGSSSVNFPYKSDYLFVYSPSPKVNQGNPPVLHDGSTAVIRAFDDAKDFTVEYDPGVPTIKVNGEDVKIVPTFGDVNQSIYPKVWPEVMRPVGKGVS